MKKAHKVKARWDRNTFPAGKKTQRGLLIEVTGRNQNDGSQTERPPLNLALVIDRSGSMGGGRLHAVIEAARGIVGQLGKKDRLSVIAFDDNVSVLFEGLKQNEAGRQKALAEISRLRTRGCSPGISIGRRAQFG
jgi:Mg-chelatase subunit ChlD